jgi:fluoroacetyl-CoA thioesterase
MLKPGLKNERTWLVEKQHLASAFGSGLVDVLATPVLVGLCEECCRTAVDPLLAEGEKTVGSSISLRHLAATPRGMHVTVRGELVEVDKRRLRFRIEGFDEVERIAEAEHERFIIDAERFDRRVAEKARRVRTQLGLGF